MSPRAPIIAGKTVILINAQDNIDSVLGKLKTKLNKFSADLGKLGSQSLAGGIAGSIGLTVFLKQFKEFDDRIRFLKTKLKTTESDLGRVVAKVRELGKTTSFTAQEVADGATILAQAGLYAKEVIDALEPTLDLARGAQITLSEAGAILANTMRSFSMETTKAGEVASQFIAAARLGTLDVLDLKESIKEVLGTVRNLNIDLPTTLALLTQMASRSLKGTKAGTSLNTALLNLASKTQTLKGMGIDLGQDLNGDKFIKFLEVLYGKLKRLGNLKRTAVLQNLFNIRGGRAITALDEIKQIIDLQKQIRSAGNEARWAARVMDEGFGGSVRRALSAVQDLAITLGKINAEPMGNLLDKVPKLAEALDQLALSNQNLVLTLTLLPVGLIAAGGALLTFSFTLGKVSSLVGVLQAGLGMLAGGINRTLTANVVGILQIKRAIGSMLKSGDQGLSALLLSPQKNKRGRIKPSSFFGRIGKTNLGFLSGLKSLGSGIRSGAGALGSGISAGLTGSANAVNKGISGLGEIDRIISAKRRAYVLDKAANSVKEVSTRLLDKEKMQLTHLTRQYMQSKAAQASATTQAMKWKKAALDQVAAQDRVINLQKQLNNDPKYVRKSNKRVLSMSGFRNKKILSLLAAEGDLGSPDYAANKADFFSGIALGERDRRRGTINPKIIAQRMRVAKAAEVLGKMQARQVAHATNLRNKAASLRQGASVSNLLDNMLAGLGSGAKSVLGGAKGLAGSGLRAIGSGLRNIGSLLLRAFRADHVKNLYNLIAGVGRLTMGFLRAANIVRRFVFSFSGILTIVEALIFFGPKIDFIRQGLEKIGQGFANAFSRIASLGETTKASFAAIGDGISRIMEGQGDTGLNLIIVGLQTMSSIIGNTLVSAWRQFQIGAGPVLDWFSKTIQSIWEVLKLTGSALGGVGSALAQGGNLFPGGDGFTLSALLSQIFDPETIKQTMLMIGGIVTELSRNIITLVQNIYSIVADTMMNLNNAILLVINTLYSILSNSRTQMLFGDQSALTNVLLQAGLVLGNSNTATEATKSKMMGAFDTILSNLTKRFEDFSHALDNIFGQKPIGGAAGEKDRWSRLQDKVAQNQAEMAMAAAAEADRANNPINKAVSYAVQSAMKWLANPTSLLPGRTQFNQFRMAGLQTAINETDNPNTALRLERQLSLLKRREQKRLMKEEVRDAKTDYRNEMKQIGYMKGDKTDRNLARARLNARLGRGRGMAGFGSVQDASELFASLVGNYDQVSRGRLKLQGKSKEDKQLEVLGNISNALGGPDVPYLRDIRDNTQGFGVLQQ